MAALADLVNFQLQNAKALSELLSSENRYYEPTIKRY